MSCLFFLAYVSWNTETDVLKASLCLEKAERRRVILTRGIHRHMLLGALMGTRMQRRTAERLKQEERSRDQRLQNAEDREQGTTEG